MKKFTDIFEKICVKAVFVISLVIFGAFTHWAGIFTHEFPYDYSEERIMGWFDSMPINLASAVIFLLLFYLAGRLVLRGSVQEQEKRVQRLVIGVMALVGVVLAVWVSAAHVTPYADQMQVYLTALEFKGGDYHDMLEYMYMFPQQYSLAFLYEGLLSFWQSYRLLQYLNILFVLMILFFSVRIADELFHNQRVNLYCLMGQFLFLPLYFYVTFVYGELCSIAMGLAGMWAVIRWCETARTRYACLAVGCMTVAVLARKNTMVVLLAVLLTLLIYALKNRRWQAVLLAALVTAVPLGSTELVKYSYELRSGYEIGEGMPAVLWIAMGMQENWNGAGVYNGYNNSVYGTVAGRDSKLAAEHGMQYIRERAREFADNPSLAWEFYRFKLLEQWNEQTFTSMLMTSHFDKDPEGLVRDIYYGKLQSVLMRYMNRYTFVLYLSVFFCALAALFRRYGILHAMLMIGVIGGVLFSLLWEAKGRYVFPYVILLFPYMAVGMDTVQKGAAIVAKRVKAHILSEEE